MITKLETIHDSRNSFYGKARVREDENGRITLISYNTEVAYIENGEAFVLSQWSQTTTRHIKEFLKQNGFKAETMKQMLNDYKVQDE